MKNILVVDNHPVMLKFMSDLMKKQGYEVLTAQDGLSALEILESFIPEIIFVDLVMPNIDGKKLCWMIRGMEQMQDVRLIIISGIAAEETVDFRAMGADGCIAKGPVNKMEEHIHSVLDLLEKGSLNDLSKRIIGLEDVCERRITGELLSAQKHSELILGTMEEGIIELTYDGRIIYVNAAGLSIIGKPEKDLLGSRFVDLFDEIRGAVVRSSMESMDKSLISTPEESPLVVNKKLVTLDVLHIDEDRRRSIVVILHDIDRRKKAETALKEREEQYRTLFETSNDAIIILEPPDWQFKTGNLATIKMFRARDEQDLISKRPDDVAPEYQPDGRRSAELARQMIQKAMSTGYHFFEWTHKRLNNEEFPSTVLLNLIELEGRQLLQATVRDITERKEAEHEKKEAERKLQQAQKMSSIATLAGGIAHQFNNALAGVLGNTELVKNELAGNSVIDKYFDSIEKSTRRMTDLTAQLLAYAKGGKYQMQELSVNDFLQNIIPLTKHAVDPSVQVTTDLPQEAMHIEADLTQLQMVLTSVLSNASEAIGKDGHIRVSAKRMHMDETFVTSHPELKKGTYACLTVQDDGKGMEKETLSRVFEPFYTTKFLGRGLGMAAAYGIVKNHGGSIIIESELNKGTKVHIYLPEVEAKIKELHPPENVNAVNAVTTLLIEDDQIVMEVNQAILEKLGYRVLGAKTGEEAVHIVNTFDGHIDLAILDIVLPDMGGKTIYPLLKKARPDLKVVVCSGYSIDGPAQDILDAGAQAFIQKPFTIKKLTEKLSAVLTSAA